MATGATSRVKLLIEIGQTGGENLDKLRKQLEGLTMPASDRNATRDLAAQTVATERLTKAKVSNAKASEQQARAQRSAMNPNDLKTLQQYTSLSAADLKIQQQRLKQALLQKREAAKLAESLEAQKRKTAELAAEVKKAEAAQKAANAATAAAVKEQSKLQAAVEAANKKLIQQGLANEQARQKTQQKFSDAVAKAEARATNEVAKAVARREAAEKKLSDALAAQQATQEKLKQKTLEAAEAAKRQAAQMQAVLKESLKKKRALAELTKKMEELRRKMKETEERNNKFIDGLENAASTAALIQGPLGGVASRIGTLATLLKDVNPLMAGTVLAVGTLATGFGVAVLKAGETEAQLLKLEAIIKATGSAAGFTVGQVDKMAKALGEASLGNATEARDAIAKLLTFKGIQGDNFERALNVMSDMAAVFGSLDEASVQLGKALEDPIQGLGSLREIGVSVTQEQQKLIEELQKSGNLWLAQQEVMGILEGQIGGAGSAAGSGLNGALESLGERWSSLMKSIGDGRALRGATFLMRELGDAILFVDRVISGSQIDAAMQDVADKADVVRQKLKDIQDGKLDASAKAALETQLSALNEQSVAMGKQQELLAKRLKIQDQIKQQQAEITENEKAGIKTDQTRGESLGKLITTWTKAGNIGDFAPDIISFVKGSQKNELEDLKKELEEVNAELVDYDKAVRKANEAEKEASGAQQRAAGLRQQKQALADATTLRKRFDREYLQSQLRTLDAQTRAEVAASEERYRNGKQSLEQYLAERTALETKQSNQQRKLLQSEATELKANLQERLDEIDKANKEIAKRGGLSINPQADPEALRLQQATRIAEEELARFQFESDQNLADIAKTRREEEEKINSEREKGAREAERDARKAKADAEALAKVVASAEEKRRKAALELRALEISGVGAVEARMQLAADVIAESFAEARKEIAAALGEEQAAVIDNLIDTKSVHAQFDALEQIYSERIGRLGVVVTNLQVQQERGRINYSDFIQGAADAYAQADKDLLNLIQRMQELADATGSETLKNRLLELQTQFETTAAAGEQFSNSVITTLERASAGIAETGFQSFFDSLFEDITDLESAFRSLGMSILQEMQKIVSSHIAKEFASMIGGFFSGGGGGGSSGGSSATGWLSTAASAIGSFFADGGYVSGPGTTRSDSIPAMLSNKEFVQPAHATAYYGVDVMEALRRRRVDRHALRNMIMGTGRMRRLAAHVPTTPYYADGGLVKAMSSNQLAGPQQLPPQVDVYNILDPAEILRLGLKSREGRTQMINWAKDNQNDVQKMWKKGD